MSVKPYRIRDLERRMPQAGRIRAGRKVATGSGRSRPEKLLTFRFTSKDPTSLAKVAELYGGTVEEWSDPLSPDTHEVYTEASEIKVALPPEPLYQAYELWNRGGCERRCDGEICTLSSGGGPDGGEPREESCLCAARGELACKLTTRLSVVLPDVRFLGTWRLDTKGTNAALELPGMVEGVMAMQDRRGFVPAVLRLDYRVEMHQGRKREFVVPMLGVDATPDQLAAGAVRLGLPEGAQAAIEAAPEPPCPGCESPYSLHRAGCANGTEIPETIKAAAADPAGVIEAKIVLPEHPNDPVPHDPELVQAWLDTLSAAQQAKVLLAARKKAEEVGLPVPSAFKEIDVELADLVMGHGTP